VAIFNWLFARHEGGAFLLRIEDTDRERSTPEAIQAVFEALAWLRLDYDEPPLYQSTRTSAHLAAAQDLLRTGHAYYADKGGRGKGECIVFRMPGTDISFRDEIRGDLRKAAADLSDFVIVRSDGTPVFHLANVVDDIEMRITHVIRGDDHIENTYRHVALFRALGALVPKYAHLPMIVNQQGKPYSKRDGAAYVGEFRQKGFLAEALFNYLALLGWSPGDDREKMTREEMVQAFSLARVKTGPAQMDVRKLTHLNQLYIAEFPVTRFAEEVRSLLSHVDWLRGADPEYFLKVCALMQSRTTVLNKAEEWKYFFVEMPDYDEKAVQKLLKAASVREALQAARQRLAEAEFTPQGIETAIRATETAFNIEQGKLNQPIRVAVTGSAIGAGLHETLALIGRSRVLKRLDYAISALCGQQEWSCQV